MLRIMERGMRDGIVILPVHDGCLCPRSKTDQVVQYFNDEGIVSVVSADHFKPLPIDECEEALEKVRSLSAAL